MDQQTADPGWSISQLWKVHSADPHSNTTDSPMKDAEGQKPVLDSPAHMWHEWCSRKGQTPRTENRSAVTSGWETLGLVELLCILTDVLVTGLNAFVRTWRVVQKWMSFKLCKLYLNEIFFFPWRRKWQLTPVFLPGQSHGQRTLVGYSPWGYKKDKYDLVTKQQQSLAPKNVTVWK